MKFILMRTGDLVVYTPDYVPPGWETVRYLGLVLGVESETVTVWWSFNDKVVSFGRGRPTHWMIVNRVDEYS